MNDEMFDDLYKSIGEASEMNDESKKLGRYRKLLNEEAGTPFEIREMWVAAFEEMLQIVDENLTLEGYDRDNALDYVRRAICDELGLTSGESKTADSEVVEPDTLCPKSFQV